MRPQRAFTWCWHPLRVLGAALSLAPLLSCGPSVLGGQNAAYSNSANMAGAALTAVAAGVVWAAAGGCRIQGCPYGSYCNQDSGFCDVRRCSQGCPIDTVCNEGLDRCQVQPPNKLPSDALPQDDKRNPPTVH